MGAAKKSFQFALINILIVCVGYKSWRSPTSGSYLMQALVKVLTERASEKDLIGMLTEVCSATSRLKHVNSLIYKLTMLIYIPRFL